MPASFKTIFNSNFDSIYLKMAMYNILIFPIQLTQYLNQGRIQEFLYSLQVEVDPKGVMKYWTKS